MITPPILYNSGYAAKMLHLHPSTVYYWYNGAADMRKGFDALCGMIHEHKPGAVLQGGVYIFLNRKRNQVKLLTWEGDGLAIYYKRLEKGVYEVPIINVEGACAVIDVVQLQLILQGIVLGSIRKKHRFSANI
jgi:transposase